MFSVSPFNRNSLELALTRPITVLDNERFTVQSVITKFVCPVVLVSYSQIYMNLLNTH